MSPSNKFTIICNDCYNEIVVFDDMSRKDREGSGYMFYAIQNTYVNIVCGCNNEVHIEED